MQIYRQALGYMMSRQIIDSQMGKVKFGQRLKAGSTQTSVGVSFVKIYHTQLKKKECLLYQDESAK